MKGLTSRLTRALPFSSCIPVCDNSGAKIIRIYAVQGHKTSKGRRSAASVSSLVYASVKKGRPDMRKKNVLAVIVRQRKEFRRQDGSRVKFEDNAAVILKDDKGNPQGTLLKGPVAKEVCERWPGIAKISSIIV